jgi:ketosteroid isomerase-like protein
MVSSPDMTRRVAERWFTALTNDDGEGALDCLDQNRLWINDSGVRVSSDLVPWLGDYHGRVAMLDAFVILRKLSAVEHFELLRLTIDGDEALAIVHEAGLVKASGLAYDIECIQRLRVADEKIVFWKSYWDTLRGIVPFRSELSARLIAAAATGAVDEVMQVLLFGGDSNARDPQSGQTVLATTAARGHVAVVQRLLQHGADPNGVDSRAGAAPLHKACQGGHLDVVKALVEAGAFVDLQSPTTGHTPLVEAIWFAADDIVSFLLDRGARVDLDTYYGFTIDQHVDYALVVNAGSAAEPRWRRF